MERWLLPEGVEESLPPEAWCLERARRRLLDLYRSWGYELIRPPLIEFLDALLTGAGHDLDIQTFKLTDQISGRMMGVRSDMTTQAARIDAHRINTEGVARYCYIGSVLRTRPDNPGGSRTPLQVGAELFGSDSLSADVEIIRLMLASLDALGIEQVSLDLGHVGIYRALEAEAGLGSADERRLFDILQRKALPDLDLFSREVALPESLTTAFASLMKLNGDITVLDKAESLLENSGSIVADALLKLRRTAEQINSLFPGMPVHIDLAELRGYRYKTGLVFAAFVPGRGSEVARGGRYDGIGKSFGRSRSATGFSTDLNALATMGTLCTDEVPVKVMAPVGDDNGLSEVIAKLRSEGKTVLQALDGQDIAAQARSLGCQSILVLSGGQWISELI